MGIALPGKGRDGLDETSGAAVPKLQRLNKAKRYRVARNPIHG